MTKLSDDKPLICSEHDKLGFGKIADHLATAFLQNDLSQGFVVGVEGAWGSGKSTLVNMALEKLESRKNGPSVIRFAPWLVGSRNELLTQFFAQLEPVILDAVPEDNRKDIKDAIRRYVQIGSRGVTALADVGESFGIPVAKLVKAISRKAERYTKESLGDIKGRIRKYLKNAKRPILVFVDDIDRLDPGEVIEVLRLIKSVADFPNVAYILAYDPEVVANSVERAFGVSYGKSFLEKVVQASFKIPNALNFDLRKWLIGEISPLLEGISMGASAANRFDRVIEQWGREYLKTPRDVVRLVNSMKLNFVPVKDHVDPGDMVFLQILRLKNSKLFGWVERYVSTLCEYSNQDRPPKQARMRLTKELSEAINLEEEEEQSIISALTEIHFPPLDSIRGARYSSANERETHVADKRLVSPDHYSYYFSFDGPSGTISDSEIERFLMNCEHASDKAVSTFRKMVENQRPQGGRLAELLLVRIVSEKDNLSAGQIEGLFQVLGEEIENLIPFLTTDPLSFLSSDIGVFGLIGRVEKSAARTRVLQHLFSEAKSLSWLACIIRSLAFARGLYGNEEEPRERWLLSEEEFNMCAEIIVRRLSESPPTDLLKTWYLQYLMLAWCQLGNSKDAYAWVHKDAYTWVQEQTIRDEAFVNVLSAMSRGHAPADDELFRHKLLPLFGSAVDVDVFDRLARIISEKTVGQDNIDEAQRLHRRVTRHMYES